MNISICKDKWHFIRDLYQYPTWLQLLFETVQGANEQVDLQAQRRASTALPLKRTCL